MAAPAVQAALDDVADALLAKSDAERTEYLAELEALDPAAYEMAEEALAGRLSIGWRRNPATFAHHLTGGEYHLWPYVELLAETIAQAFKGNGTKRIINIASQYGKTSALRWACLWALDYDPTLRIMYVSYDADKAVEEGGLARDDAERYADKLRFSLRSDRRARGMWRTEQGGGLYCTGARGSIVGFPADAVLGDDLFKGWQEAHSPAHRRLVHRVYDSQMRMRVQGPECPIVLAGTRWHDEDLFGHVMDKACTDPEADQWQVLRLPTLAEENDPLGREVGEVLEARRFPLEEVQARRAGLGSYLFAAMEAQRPAPEEGGELKRDWWRLEDRMPERGDASCSSWDMKLKDKESGDFVVGVAMLRTGPDFWMVDLIRGQFDQATTTNAIALMAVRHPHIATHVVENTGNGPEVMQALRQALPDYVLSSEMIGRLGMTEPEVVAVQALRRQGLPGIVPNNPKGSKDVRARAVAPYVEAGNVHLPASASWVQGFLDETAAFGAGAAHDDQVDAWSQAMGRLARSGSSSSVADGSFAQRPPTRTVVPLGRFRG